MPKRKIKIQFSLNKRTGRHVLTVSYESSPGTPLYLHNKDHRDLLGEVASALKQQGLEIDDFEVVVKEIERERPAETEKKRDEVVKTGQVIKQ